MFNATMSDTAPVIKQEPRDDEQNAFEGIPFAGDFSMNVDDEDEPMFVEEETVLERATNNEGRPYPTVCFAKPYLQHPHHHRLICGHDIVTKDIERCGANCAPSKKDEKPGGTPFDCPEPICRSQVKVFRPKAGSAKPRKCTLSHVYGRDPAADQKRLDEKSDDRNSRNAQATRRRGVGRKQSQSPSPAKKKRNTKSNTKGAKAKKSVDRGELLNREFGKDPSRKHIIAFSGPGVRPKIGGRFKTDAESARDVEDAMMTRGMKRIQMATKQEQMDRAKSLAKLRADFPPPPDKMAAHYLEADTEPKPNFDIPCNNCGKVIDDVRHHCFDCVDFDLCAGCFEKNGSKHSSHHRIKALDKPIPDWREDSDAQKYSFCVCGTSSTTYLVLCVDCQIPFHPGCIGAGHYQKLEYEIDSVFREECLKHDHAGWKGGEDFRCGPCKKVYVAQQVDDSRKARAEEREKRRQNGETEKPSAFREATSKKRAASKMDEEEDSSKVEVAVPPRAKRTMFSLPLRPLVRVPSTVDQE